MLESSNDGQVELSNRRLFIVELSDRRIVDWSN